jgi:hypothetical protein
MTHRIFAMPFSRVYSLYLAKAERKGRSQAEVDHIIQWVTGYDADGLNAVLNNNADFRAFFAVAPVMHRARDQITGVICGVRIEQITDPLMRDIRILDKMIDDLAKGKPIAKILRD